VNKLRRGCHPPLGAGLIKKWKVRKMLINNVFEIQEIVYLKTDSAQLERVVTAIQMNPGGLLYRLACGNGDSWHYAFEISKEKDVMKKK